MEFEIAAPGIIGLESAFALAHTKLKGKLPLEQIVDKFVSGPRQVLQMTVPEIKKGSKANLTLFNPALEWVFSEKDIRSKSKNTPFIGTPLTGKAVAVYNNGLFARCD